MTSAEFIRRIQIAVYESSIDGTVSLLEKPPGRRPSPSLVALSQWYNNLPSSDKERVRASIQLAVRTAVFGILTVLDGVRSIREAGEEKGSLNLRYTAGTESVLLNSPDSELLHDIFASLVPPA
jgi:hypothetical protein